ncbi:glutamate-1-semialdehyde aminotransferase [Nocardia sp. GAS34]|uniref:hypothetical protein n=1 Tax=Nocardia sp. GAS34 TaxID=3156305 RepID=UPI003D196266
MLTSAGSPGSLRRVGSLLQFVPRDQATSLHGTDGIWAEIAAGMLEAGAVFMPSGKIFLSTAHTLADIQETAALLERVLQQISARSA